MQNANKIEEATQSRTVHQVSNKIAQALFINNLSCFCWEVSAAIIFFIYAEIKTSKLTNDNLRQLPSYTVLANFIHKLFNYNVIDLHTLFVGIFYVTEIYRTLNKVRAKNKENNSEIPRWVKNYNVQQFTLDDEYLCIMALMLAHKGPEGEDSPYNNASFLLLYNDCYKDKRGNDTREFRLFDHKFNQLEILTLELINYEIPRNEEKVQEIANLVLAYINCTADTYEKVQITLPKEELLTHTAKEEEEHNEKLIQENIEKIGAMTDKEKNAAYNAHTATFTEAQKALIKQQQEEYKEMLAEAEKAAILKPRKQVQNETPDNFLPGYVASRSSTTSNTTNHSIRNYPQS